MQTGIGGGSGAQECVARGLMSAPLCGLVEGPRGSDLDSGEINNGTDQL